MPRRPRQRSGSINISGENATTIMVRRRVLNTYSRVCPRQPVNRHHFLTPDTPFMEELELPSHLLTDSTGEGVRDETSSLIIASVPTSAKRTPQSRNKHEDADKVDNDQCSSAKKPKLDISNTETGVMMENDTIYNGTATKEQKRRKQPVRRRNRKRKAPRKPRRGATPAHAESVELKTLKTRTGIVVDTLADIPHLQQDATTRDVTAMGAGQPAQDHTHISCNLEPVSMEMTCETTMAGRANSVQQSLPAHNPFTSTTKAQHIPGSTSKKVKKFLETIAAELGHTRAGNSSGFQECQGPANVSLNTVTSSDKDATEHLTLRSDSKHYTNSNSYCCGTPKQALRSDSEDEIEVPRKRDRCEFEASTEGVVFPGNKDLPPLEFSTDAPSRSSLTTKGDGPTILECMDKSTLTTAQKRQARKRTVRQLRVDLASLCSGVEPSPSAKGLQHRDTVSVSKDSDPKSTAKVRTSKKNLPGPKRSDSLEKGGGRNDLPGSNTTPFKKSAVQKRGSDKRNGLGSFSNSTLKEHFSGLQLTPITCPAPLPEAPPTTRTLAPLTSTPVGVTALAPLTSTPVGVTALAPLTSTPVGVTPLAPLTSTPVGVTPLAPLTSTPVGVSSKTATNSSPRRVCGLVHFECTPVLNTATTTTPFLNRYNSACPITSTPIDPPACPLGEASNVRQCGTPGGSWVGNTMDRLLEFDEIGFEASERLESVERHNTRSKAAERHFNSRTYCTSSPRPVARSSPSKRLQQRRGKEKDHSRKTGSKSVASSKSAKRQNKPIRENAGKQRASAAKPTQEHIEGRVTGKRGRKADNADTKAKRAKSTEKAAPRRGSAPKPSAEQEPFNPATTKNRRKKTRCVIPPALRRCYNKNKVAADNSNSSSTTTGVAPRNKCSPTNTYDTDTGYDPERHEDYPTCILVQLSRAARTTHHRRIKFQNLLSDEESILDDILCA